MVKNIEFQITDEKRISYLRDSTYARGRQNSLVPQGQTQNLVWTIIYILAEAHLCQRITFVSDVCCSVKSSRTTTLKAINRMVQNKVLKRQNDKTDKRRKILTISPSFRPKLFSYLDETISRFMISDVIKKIEEETKFSASQTEYLLSSLKEAPIPLMIHAEDGEVLMISKEWERLTGYKHRDIPTIKKWTEKAYGKNTKNNTVPEMRKLISTLHGIKSGDFEDSAHVHTKNGKVMIWNFRSAPLGKLADGRSNIISIATTVTP